MHVDAASRNSAAWGPYSSLLTLSVLLRTEGFREIGEGHRGLKPHASCISPEPHLALVTCPLYSKLKLLQRIACG